MKRIVLTAIASCVLSMSAVASMALAANSAGWAPHPAVVRIMAPESNGASFGSGALVAVNDTHGLVVTNWHVVRDATGPITVFFPDGFHSGATVLRTDRDWDLAALAIWRPKAAPIPLAAAAPQPGEALAIAGYGSGDYRGVAGRCTQYVSPGGNQPFEMVELDAPARNGDSGGPILNGRGELAGILFGSAFGRTTGSYCGRVRWFLSSVSDEFRQMPSQTLIAKQQQQQREQPANPVAAIPATAPSTTSSSTLPTTALASSPTTNEGSHASTAASGPMTRSTPSLAANHSLPNVSLLDASPSRPMEAKPIAAMAMPSKGPLPSTDQLKTIFAAIGVLAVFYAAMRLLGAAVG